MRYALIGDIHSDREALQHVLKQVSKLAPDAKVIGTGDLFECKISKKDITDQKFQQLEEVMKNPPHFAELLNFPTVYGNQEERILLITETEESLREWIEQLPKQLEIEGATVIHGHQWQWGGNPWSLQQANTVERLVFYGHSHTSMLSIDSVWQTIEFGKSYDVSTGQVLVNVGSVVDNEEWVLYDAREQHIIFYKVNEEG